MYMSDVTADDLKLLTALVVAVFLALPNLKSQMGNGKEKGEQAS